MSRVWRHVERDRCGFCGHRHALEIGYRCAGCDREVCALCVVTLREAAVAWCPECAAGEPEAEPPSGGAT